MRERSLRLASVLLASMAVMLIGASNASALSLGVGWIGSWSQTEDINEWNAIQQSKSEMFRVPITPANTSNGSNWSYYDKVFGLAAERGVTILPTLAGNLAGGLSLPTEGEKIAWEEWAKQAVRRYGYNGTYWSTHPGVPVKPVIAWEIWNEPNNSSINEGTITATEYGKFLAWAGTAVQAASESWGGKTTGVLFGGLLAWSGGTNYQTYLQNAYEMPGAASAFTGLSFHPYELDTTQFPGKTRIQAFEKAVNGARSFLNSLGANGKSLWITETGWPAEAEYGVGEAEQASLLRQSFDWSKANAATLDLHALIWFNYRDTNIGNTWQYRSGLRTQTGAFRQAWYTFLEETGAPRWPTISKDLYSVLMNRAGSGKTEVHVLEAATNYETFRLEVPTHFEETTASQWQFSFADYNRDGIPDLIGVLMNGTGSKKTEVHILNGASNYSKSLLDIATPLEETTSSQWQFTVGDYNRDGIPDLIGVLMNGTGSKKTEVHILNGATNYSTSLLDVATGLEETSSSQWQFTVGDYNRDGIPDLIGVLMNGTGSKKTEVHIFDGASPSYYSTALLRTGTGLEETKPQQWQFSAGDYNGDGIPDLLGVLMNGTGTGQTEAHILDGASNYQSFLLHAGTALSETTASQWQFAGAHVSGDWHPIATTEPATGIGTEEATLNGVVNPQGISTTYHFEYGTTTSYGSSTPESGSIGNGTSNVAVSKAITGLSPGMTYHFRVAATNLEGTSYGQDRTFNTTASGTAGQLSGMAVTEPFNGSSGSLANFSTNWTTLGWASGTSPKGEDTTAGWRPVNAFPTVNGAFYNPVITDTGPGIATVATMATNPSNAERNFSLWLDLQSPTGAKAGYELRFTDVSSGVYNVTLAKWQGGTETVLTSKSSYSFVNGNSFALVDQGSTVSAWTKTGSEFSQLLSASDASFGGGNAAIQGAGNITRLTNFKAGALLTPVANMDAALKSLPVNDAFSTNESPLSGGGAWAALAWDNSASGHNTGRVEGGWGPYDAYSTINGAYWQKASFADSGAGDAVAALLYGNPTIASRYFSLWLNAPNPASARSGYELRLTETSSNVYEVALSKWQSGTKTVLASKAGYSFPTGSQFALVDKAGTVSAWMKTGSEYTQLLSAADSTFINGYTGIEGSGNITRLKEFRGGPLAPF
jgi:hypothetical protein